MRSVMAMARLTFQHAIRSKLVLLLCLGLCFCVLWLPGAIRSDDTATGLIRLLLQYSLGIGFFFLSLNAVWSGCASFATDIEDKYIHMVHTKPVSATCQWVGKWLGVLFLNALLLGISGIIVYGYTQWHLSREALPLEGRQELTNEILVGRSLHTPDLSSAREAALDRLKILHETGTLKEGSHDDEVLNQLEKMYRNQALTVRAGKQTSWTLVLPPQQKPEKPVYLYYQFSLSTMYSGALPARWEFTPGLPGSPVKNFTVNTEHIPRRFEKIRVPPEALPLNGGSLHITLFHPETQHGDLLLTGESGFEIFTYQSPFYVNLIKALVIHFAQLAFFAALGVTAGALFSFPVASFCAFSAIAFQRLSGFITPDAFRQASEHHHGHNQELEHHPSWWQAVLEKSYAMIEQLVTLFQSPPVLTYLAEGQILLWKQVMWSLLGKGILLSVITAMMGIFFLNRRELALGGRK